MNDPDETGPSLTADDNTTNFIIDDDDDDNDKSNQKSSSTYRNEPDINSNDFEMNSDSEKNFEKDDEDLRTKVDSLSNNISDFVGKFNLIQNRTVELLNGQTESNKALAVKLEEANREIRAIRAEFSLRSTQFANISQPASRPASRQNPSRSNRAASPTNEPLEDGAFTRPSRTTLKVPKDRQEEIKRMPGVESQPCRYRGGDWIYAIPNTNLDDFSDFFTEEVSSEYKRHLGVDVFTRSQWTKLNIEPDDPRWSEISKLPYVRTFNNNGKRNLTVPPRVDIMPLQHLWPEYVEKEYDNSTKGRDNTNGGEFTRDKRTRLIVPPSREEEVLKIPGAIKEFSYYGNKGDKCIFMERGMPLLPVKNYWTDNTRTEYKSFCGDELFTREKWTPLNVREGTPEWTRIANLPEISEFSNRDGKAMLSVRPGTDVLPFRDFWIKPIRDEYESDVSSRNSSTYTPGTSTLRSPARSSTTRNSPEFTRRDKEFIRQVDTILDISPGEKNWNVAKDIPNVRMVGDHLTIPSGKNVLPAKDFWPRTAQRDYDSRMRQTSRT